MPTLERQRDQVHFSQTLHQGWTFGKKGDTTQHPAIVPGGVIQSLLAENIIPNPLFGQNEDTVQWIGETDWAYSLGFERPFDGDFVLCFDGLDTFCTVYLNGKPILTSSNMFLAHRVPVQLEAHNKLEVHFLSPWHEGKRLEALHGGKQPLWNGDSSRLYVRKAQYHYGWDWGPKLLEQGIWQPVRLECFSARVTEVHVQTHLEPDFSKARLAVNATLEGDFADTQTTLTFLKPNGEVLHHLETSATANLQTSFEVQHPELWYTHDLGVQPMYQLQVQLERDGVVLHTHRQSFAIRQIELVQAALETGKTFYFRLNGKDVFCGGANWIPEDLLVPRVTPERYRAQLEAARAANMNMLRVWGGGIYEQDVFYDLCDELGLLVWQDFMFACGIYPDYFLESVRLEAVQQLKRLRRHPCIAIWTGNNEDYQLAHGLGLQDFPAKKIYETLLPSLVAQYAPDAIYQAGSPFQGADPDDATLGDKHVWNIWGRAALPYRAYREEGGRFVSEFGMAAAPHIQTLQNALPSEDLHPKSAGMLHHLRASEGMWRLEQYLADLGDVSHDLPEFIYRTQLVQSEALDCAYRIWRKGWNQHRETGGVLVWQLNDCWAVTGWAIIDSEHRKKPAYYAVKRALAPISVNLWATKQETEIWAVNTGKPHTLTLELCAFQMDGTLVLSEQRIVHLEENACTVFAPWIRQQNLVVSAKLLYGNAVLARHAIFPEPFKEFGFCKPTIHLEWQEDRLHLVSDVPTKGVWLEGDFEDNMIDLMPNEPQVVQGRPNLPLPALRWYTP
jgi:beta-mannosidase